MSRQRGYGAGWVAALLVGLVLVARGVTPGGASSAADEWRWWATGDMIQVRSSHTATLLADGRVLVVGGWGIDSVTDSAETYDPATGLWSAAGTMSIPRVDHTATRLADGRVLVVGGFDGVAYTPTAELFDPATGLWSAAERMSDARAGHTATLLPGGEVLIAGGYDAHETKSHSARYDPATDSWASAGAMQKARAGHTATPLDDGRVLVVGGYAPGNVAELYDPATGVWRYTGGLGLDFPEQHTALRLADGRVYGLSAGAAAVYDPAAEAWLNWPAVDVGENFAAALLADGRVMAGGGLVFPSSIPTVFPIPDVYLIDPATGEPEGVRPMIWPRADHTATTLGDGRVLVAGGWGNTAEIFGLFVWADTVFLPVMMRPGWFVGAN